MSSNDEQSNDIVQKELRAFEKDNTDDARQAGQMVVSRWNEADQLLADARKDYELNLSFYRGAQWITWDQRRGQAQPLPPRYSESERVRYTDNQIEPRIDTLLGVLSERDLVFEGDPSDADDQSVSGSQLGESILESARVAQDWELIRRENLLGALLGGVSAISVEWDRSGGERLWVNDANQQVIGTGEVFLNQMSINEFTLEPGSRRPQDSNWWIGHTAVPVEQVREHYSLDWTPEPDIESTQARYTTTRDQNSMGKLCSVYVMYERPNRKCPKGRCLAVVSGIAVKDSKWNFPFNDLNIAVFRQGVIPGKWNGKTFVSAARPVQVILNAIRSNIAEHAKMAGNARMLVPFGALDDVNELTDEAGEIVQYHPEPNSPPPGYMVPPPLSNSMIAYCEQLESSLDNILHAHDVARGVAPGDRNSGLALSILAEKNNTPLGPMTHDQAQGWGKLGTLVLKLYGGNVDETRKATVMSKMGVAQQWEWSGSSLRGQTTVRVPIDAVAPYTRAQMLANLQSLQNLQPEALKALPVERILKATGFSSTRELMQGINPDVAKAMRENDKMSVGEVQTPAKWDDHSIHIAELNAFRKTQAYESSPPEIQEIFEAHVQAHENLAHEELMQTASMNAVQPGLGALPQADDPMGSALPAPFQMGAGGLSEEQPLPPGPPM